MVVIFFAVALGVLAAIVVSLVNGAFSNNKNGDFSSNKTEILKSEVESMIEDAKARTTDVEKRKMYEQIRRAFNDRRYKS